MTPAEAIAGVDFVLSKIKNDKFITVGVQVKRNRNQSYYEFDEREREQLKHFENAFPNGYYMFIDETGDHHMEWFVRVPEVREILNSSEAYQTRIPII